MTAQYGDEKYGSTDGVFNEKDYVTILPCIYGFQPGLQVQNKTVAKDVTNKNRFNTKPTIFSSSTPST